MDRRFAVASSAIALVLIALAPPSSARVRPTTPPAFDGQCDFSGQVRFTPAITAQPTPGGGRASAKGTCSGDLTWHGKTRQVSDASATYRAHSRSDLMGCAGGPATGAGVIRLGGHRLRFTLQETRAAAASELHLDAAGWTGNGTAAASSSADPVAVATACGGSGLTTAPIDLSLTLHRS